MSSLLTFIAWSRPFLGRCVGTPKTKIGEKRPLPASLKASGSLAAPQHWAGGGCSAQAPPPHSGPRVAMGTARLPGRPPPAGPPSIMAVARGGGRGGTGRAQLRACPCDHAGTIWRRKGRRDGSCLLGTTENIVSMSAGYDRLTFIRLWTGDRPTSGGH